MACEKVLLESIAKIEADVNGVIATATVDLESGMTLAADRGSTNLAILRTAVGKHVGALV